MQSLKNLRARFGDFWWWSLAIFLACRSGDVIQAFAGLWLVPRFVGTADLGAALPLIQLSSVFALPLSILTIPFSRWLTLYTARGETGKVKTLLLFAFCSVVIAFLVVLVMAKAILPHFFLRLRVAEGSLGLLLIVSGLIGPLANVFTSALQGLKRFGALTLTSAIGAPLRLIVLLVAMPFRALSGYLLGQIVPPAANIALSLASLRGELGRKVKRVAIDRTDLAAMLRYTWPIAINTISGAVCGAWIALLFRQRLPEVESAAYYMISRLAEIASYAGLSLAVVVFPFATEAGERGDARAEAALFKKILLGSFLPGVALTLLFFLFGRAILSAVPLWSQYAHYAPYLAIVTFRMSLLAAIGAFSACEMAAGRFRYLLYLLPISAVECGGLVALSGYGALAPFLPDCIDQAVAALNPCRLSFFIWWLSACTFAQILGTVIHLICRHRRRSRAVAISCDAQPAHPAEPTLSSHPSHHSQTPIP